MIRMIIADDEPITRQGLQMLNWVEQGFDIVGVAANGIEARELIRAERPDLLLTDIRMPSLNGLALMEMLSEELPGIKVIFITAYHQLEYALKAIELGAAGFVLKPTDPDEIMGACLKAKELIDKERQRSVTETGLRRQVKEYALTLQGIVRPERAGERRHVIRDIVAYLEAHYMEDITISEISDMFHFHPDYLSRLFKKETGENFSDTLIRIRMRKVVDLLGDPDIKVYEMAGRVGIRDARYFGQLFKKRFGVTPNEFRKELLLDKSRPGGPAHAPQPVDDVQASRLGFKNPQ